MKLHKKINEKKKQIAEYDIYFFLSSLSLAFILLVCSKHLMQKAMVGTPTEDDSYKTRVYIDVMETQYESNYGAKWDREAQSEKSKKPSCKSMEKFEELDIKTLTLI